MPHLARLMLLCDQMRLTLTQPSSAEEREIIFSTLEHLEEEIFETLADLQGFDPPEPCGDVFCRKHGPIKLALN